jgi:hypothetical protein
MSVIATNNVRINRNIPFLFPADHGCETFGARYAEAPASANTDQQKLIGFCATLHLPAAKAETGASAYINSRKSIVFHLLQIGV